jgi:glycosyltransferase involved in cell wall biosynthesis
MIIIVQPWFSAAGHPAQSLINLAKIVGNYNGITYLTSIMSGNHSIEEASRKLRLLVDVVDYPVNTPSIREGTLKALTSLRKMFSAKPSINTVFFLDAHLVLLSALWSFYARKNIRYLGVVYLMGPERVTRYNLIKYLIARFLKRKEVVLFLRTDELVTDWKKAFPSARIKCLPSLEMPFEENLVIENPLPSKIVRLGVFGQIRTGKSLEWLVPFFMKNPSLGKLTVAGAFSQPAEHSLQKLLKDYDGFKEEFLQEQELLKVSSEQDYLLMLYDKWDSRMEGAVMFLAARVNRPVIVYDKGWCGRMVNTYNNGLCAPDNYDLFTDFIQTLPKNGSNEYQKLLEGVAKFRDLHSGNSVREAFLDAILA